MKQKASYKEIIRLTLAGGYTQREIASAANCSAGTVQNVRKRFDASGLDGPTALEMSEAELRGVLNEPQGKKVDVAFKQPDFAAIYAERSKNRKITLEIAWEEYADEAVRQGLRPYMYSFFVQKYHAWENFNIPTLRISHTPGDCMEVDWAGDTMELVDPFTGEISKVYLFVATLPFSQYTYVEPALSMNTNAWIEANVHALRFFGGSPRIIVPDNLKTGVISNNGEEVILNRTYQEFGEHYKTAIIPANVGKPKMKASVEGSVGKIGERIIVMLRKRRFFSMEELEQAISEKLEELNSRPFNKRRDGSRKIVFDERERKMLAPLPDTDYEPVRWVTRTVAPDYRVSVDSATYSVPFENIGKKAEVRIGSRVVEIYCDGERVATHPLAKDKGSDVKQDPHQPAWHTEFLERSGERYLARAIDEIGPYAYTVIDSFLKEGRVEEKGYRSCDALFKLLERYSAMDIEYACERVVGIAKQPSIKAVKILLRTRPLRSETQDALQDYAILRDENYYIDPTDTDLEDNQ